MTTGPLVPGVDVRLDGTSLDPLLVARTLEVRVETHLMLPDMFSMRVDDPDLRCAGGGVFAIGQEIDVLLQASDKHTQTPVFNGLLTSLEPDFATAGAIMAVRGHDRSYLLNRTPRTATYQSQTAGEVARVLAGRSGLEPGTIEPGGGPHEFIQQSNETDWQFLWRLAGPVGFEVVVEARKLHFRPFGGPAPGPPLPLTWGVDLLSFRPRQTQATRVDEVVVRGWDPQAKAAIVASARQPGPSPTARSRAASGGSVVVCDYPVADQEQAKAVAQAIATQLGDATVHADGLARGDPRLRAGAQVNVDGVGSLFAGVYTLSETAHVFRWSRGYHTELRVSGRSTPGLAAIAAPAARRFGWQHPVVVGIVTNNKDPHGQGRVRVKYPTLDQEPEGWWARMTAPAAGANRGLLMMPVVGEEVLVAFEHGATERPYIIGSVWNGPNLPQTLVHEDGSFHLRSDQQLIAAAAGQITVQGEQAVALSAATDMTLKATGQLTEQSVGNATLKTDAALTLEGVQSVKVDGLEVAVQAGADAAVKAGASVSVQAGADLALTGAVIRIEAEGSIVIAAPSISLG